MDNNTHSAFIIGDGFSAFVDGIPDTCDHAWDGPPYEVISSKEEDKCYQMAPSDESSEEFHIRMDDLKSQGKWVSEGGVTCSKCGKYFSPPMY